MHKKICYVCSSGGHFDEMTHVRQQIAEIDSFVITESTAVNTPEAKDTYFTNALNRKDFFWAFKLIGLFFQGLSILRKEKPGMIVSFGAMVTFPFCLAGKILGIKVVFVESIARVYSLSLTGKLIYPFADLFVVQWEELLKEYPKAVYGGWVYG